MKRYFKGTLDGRVYFRASATKAYRSVIADPRWDRVGFSSTVANGVGVNDAPAVEITKAEYDALVAAKRERMAHAWEERDRTAWGTHMDQKPSWWGNSPQDSWIDAR